MRFSHFLSGLAIAAGVASAAQHSGRSLKHVGREDIPRGPFAQERREAPQPMHERRAAASQYLTNSTKKYSVNGTAIPEVDFDIGESYAGLMPISKKAHETRELYFWFFPTTNPAASDEILIWLNGGPGCSSLEGLLQENGPFLWQYGTYKPVPNPYTWVNLTNVVWVEQPVGTGFSQGVPTAKDEKDVAAQFLGFWENFMDTFNLKGRKVFITGESYAGYYVPYIADAMLNKNDTKYHNLEATMIYDPSVSYGEITNQIPSVAFVDYWYGLMPFNDTFMASIHNMSKTCGYDAFMEEYLGTYPPPGPMPPQNKLPGYNDPSCDVYDAISNEIFWINPCWDIYQVATTCPLLWDVLGYPGSFEYLPAGASIYFNRTDVQKAINAPIQQWSECTNVNVFPNGDASPPSGVSVLPSVIERSKRTIIGHGALDMVLLANGTLLTIQNMTWHGKQGFQTKPTEPFYVPYHDDPSLSTLSASGVMGTTHTERGLTYVGIDLSGHMVPQYQPSSSYRHLEFLLGRIPSLSYTGPFTTMNSSAQSTQPAGNGTAPPPKRDDVRGMEEARKLAAMF